MTRRALAGLVAVVAAIAPGPAQQGDRAGEVQTELPRDLVVPPAIVRSAAEALATFVVQPGFVVQLVAAEPLVGDPVAATFDAAGRLWVVEMRGFMNDVDATGERDPSGVVAVLHDRDGDGRMDERSVFLDDLVLPRAVLPLRGGALVIEPPNLWWCPDRDGDLAADGKELVMGGFEAGLDNPEHSGNGLLWGLDHRIHLANDKRLVRWTPEGFRVESGAGGGQWGITHDDRGRCYFNYNEDWLRCDLVPGRYASLAGGHAPLPGTNHRLLQDTSVWPIRITPGVNRGYQKGRLVDFRLAIHTAVCGPHVYRGDVLPCDGDVFVCEPAGHVVRRIVLREDDGRMRGENAYQAQRQEFLASTDERFRPVNLFGGPDGALYVVDMYRGVIQHKNFVTSFLRRQILERDLERPIGLGRIWRVVPADRAVLPKPPSLHGAPVAELVAALGAANGALRDLALQELVQRQERAAAPALRAALRAHHRPGCRIALLSALAGLHALESADLRLALHDPDPGVVAFALQHVAPHLLRGDGMLWTQLELRALAGPPTVAWHAALALGEVLAAPLPQPASRPLHDRRPRALALLARLAERAEADATLAGLVAVAATGLETDLLRTVQERGAAAAPIPATLRELARAAVRRRSEPELLAFFALFERSELAWQRQALLRGAVQALPKGAGRQGWLSFAATPPALAAAVAAGDDATARLATELLSAIALRGEAPPPPPVARTADELRRIGAGQRVYASACAACHQPDGSGMAGLAPPLRGSEWVAGPPERVLRIVLHGVRGPIEVDGTTWSLEMPGQRHLGDDDVAAVVSYVRHTFGPGGSPVTPADVAARRAADAARQEPWTADELLR